MHLMKAFFFIVIFFISTAFFWDDEEKQLKQHYVRAETAFTKEKYEEAVESYSQVLSKLETLSWQKVHMDWRTYVDTVLRLSLSFEALEKYEEANRELSKLLARKPPEEHLAQIKLLKARLTNQKSPKDQYRDLRSLFAIYPKEHWKKEDLSFFNALEFTLNSEYDALFQKAKRNYAAGLYNEAALQYEELVAAIEKGYYPKADSNSFLFKKLGFHLAECLYYSRQYNEAIKICEKNQEADREMIYLAARCFKEKQEYEKALDYFQKYFRSGELTDLAYYDGALFEMGNTYYQKKDYEKAKEPFQLLASFGNKKSKTTHLASLYLSKIYLHEKTPEKVENELTSIQESLSDDDPLKYEAFFLRAQAFYLLARFQEAKELFEKALPPKKAFGNVTKYANHYLAMTYLKLAEESLDKKEKCESYFEIAEELFKKGETYENGEEGALALARLYLLKENLLSEPACEKLQDLFSKKFESFSKEAQLEALLFKARSEKEFEKKEAYFAEAINDEYASLPRYSGGLNATRE